MNDLQLAIYKTKIWDQLSFAAATLFFMLFITFGVFVIPINFLSRTASRTLDEYTTLYELHGIWAVIFWSVIIFIGTVFLFAGCKIAEIATDYIKKELETEKISVKTIEKLSEKEERNYMILENRNFTHKVKMGYSTTDFEDFAFNEEVSPEYHELEAVEVYLTKQMQVIVGQRKIYKTQKPHLQ